MRKPIILVCALMVLAPAWDAWGADYLVSPTGNDLASGLEGTPWRTIQKAADTAVAGDTVTVLDGDYDELVRLDQSGTSTAARIVFRSQNLHGAKCLGFVINGFFVSVEGFEVEADAVTNYTGISVQGAGGVAVRNNYVHDCPTGGIVLRIHNSSLPTDCEVTGNLLEHNGQLGIRVSGSHVLIENNEVTLTVQHHPKGDEPGLTGQDADGIRVFGDNLVVRGNNIHDIADPDDPANIDPHADCFQTWVSNGYPVLTYSVIERNYCRVVHSYGKGFQMETTQEATCTDITIRNNVFEFQDIGINASDGNFVNFLVYNNLFKAELDDGSWGCAAYFREIENYAFQNNIIVDAHPESRKIEGGTGVVSHNLLWFSNGQHVTGTPTAQTGELWDVDPMFVDYNGEYGGDLHLREGSPAIDVGVAIADVTEDFDGIPRPQGEGYDIGPFEYHTGGPLVDAGVTDGGGAAGDAAANADSGSGADASVAGSDSDSGCGCRSMGLGCPVDLMIFLLMLLAWWAVSDRCRK